MPYNAGEVTLCDWLRHTRSRPMASTLLTRIRKLALALPETDEASPFGDPWFRVQTKMFVCFTTNNEEPAIVVKVGKENLGIFLNDPRFYESPYIGRHGWVGLRLNDKPDWREVEALIRDSYNRVAPKRLRLPSSD